MAAAVTNPKCPGYPSKRRRRGKERYKCYSRGVMPNVWRCKRSRCVCCERVCVCGCDSIHAHSLASLLPQLKTQATYTCAADYARQRYREDGISSEEAFLEAKLPSYIESLRARSYFSDDGTLVVLREGDTDPRKAKFLDSLMDLDVEVVDDDGKGAAPARTVDE